MKNELTPSDKFVQRSQLKSRIKPRDTREGERRNSIILIVTRVERLLAISTVRVNCFRENLLNSDAPMQNPLSLGKITVLIERWG